jgi:hypothetical protein
MSQPNRTQGDLREAPGKAFLLLDNNQPYAIRKTVLFKSQVTLLWKFFEEDFSIL